MTMLSGAALLSHGIRAHGAQTIFALAGATHAPLLLDFEASGGTIIGGRHESGTVGAADGYARRTGRIGFALIVAEQGLQNAMTALMTAAQAESPVVVIATRFPDSWVEPAVTFSVDRHELTAPFLKFSRTVPSADRLGEYLAAACKAATEGVPGPALLVVPMNFMTSELPAKLLEKFATPALPATSLPCADSAQIEQAARQLAAAKRPIIIADNGAAWAEAGPALQRLADLGIAVLGNSLARGLVPEIAPTGYPWPYAQLAAHQADTVLVVGAHMSMWFGYGKAPRFHPDAHFIHIDANPAAISRNVTVDQAILGHPAKTIDAIADLLESQQFRGDPSWLANALEDRRERVASYVARPDQPLHQIDIGAACDALLPSNRLLVCDGADIMNFTYGTMRLHQARSYANHLPLGAMGCGFPLAVGMAAAEQELAAQEGRDAAPTVLITGDGSIGFFLAELDTVQRAGLKLTILVSNDAMWGTEYHGQTLAYGRDVNTKLGSISYAAIAAGFGMASVSVTDIAELRSAITAAAQPDAGPILIDVQIDPLGGKARKLDPLLAMILFEDIAKDH